MRKTHLTLLEYLYTALRSEYGVWVESADASKLRTKLYKVIAQENEPDFKLLTFALSPINPQRVLWIVKKVPDDDETSTA